MLVSEFITNSYKLWLSTAQGVLAALYFNRHRTEWLLLFEANFSSFFIGRAPTTCPANNCLQRMVCSCAMPSNSVWLQIIFCSCISETMLFSFFRSLLHGNCSFPKIFIKKTKLVNEWEDNYWTLLSQFIVICHCLTDQLFDLLATDKLKYFAQPCPITTHMSNIHVTHNNCTRGNMTRTAMAKQWQLVALLLQG